MNNEILEDSIGTELNDSIVNESLEGSLGTEIGNEVSNQSLEGEITEASSGSIVDSISDSFSSTNDIYFDYDKAKDSKAKLQECNSNINKDIKELQSMLENLGTYWKGTMKDAFVTEVEEYINAYNQYNSSVEAGYEGLEKASTSYSSLNDTYASETI